MANIPQMTLDVVLFITYSALFSCVGTIGNILTLLVYSKRTFSLAQRTFVVTLAILDLFVCTTVIPYTVLLELKFITSDGVCHAMEFVRTFSVLASNAALVVIAGERYIAVAKPLHLPSSRKKTIVMVVLLLIIVPVSIPAGFTFTITQTNICPGNQTVMSSSITDCFQYSCEYTTEFLSPLGGDVYKLIHASLFVLGIILIITWYTLVYKILYMREKSRRLQRIHIGPGCQTRSKGGLTSRGKFISKRSPNIISIQSCEGVKNERRQQSGFCKEPPKEDSIDYCIKTSVPIQVDQQERQQVLRNTLVLENCKTYLDTPNGGERDQPQNVHQSGTICIHSMTQQLKVGPKEPDATHVHKTNGLLPSTSHMGTDSQMLYTSPDEMMRNKANLDDCSPRARTEKTGSHTMTVVSDLAVRVEENWARRSAKLSKIYPASPETLSKIQLDINKTRSMVHRKTSTMLFICTVIFVFCWIPFWIDVFDVSHSLTVRYLFLAGHASNPIVYGIVNAEVRERIFDILTCKRRK